MMSDLVDRLRIYPLPPLRQFTGLSNHEGLMLCGAGVAIFRR
jgi:hypothetical protein